MEKKAGEVIVSPKKVFWTGMPVTIEDRDRFELLKKDVFLYDCKIPWLTGLKAAGDEFSAYLFNLDKILRDNPNYRALGPVPIAQELIRYIKSNDLQSSFVHTTMIDENMKQMFKASKIAFIQRDMQYQKNAWPLIYRSVLPLFDLKERGHREYARVQFHPYQSIPVAIKNLMNPRSPIVTGVLKDLSLNGLGLSVRDSKQLNHFQLRDLVQITVVSPSIQFNVANAFLTRVDHAARTMAINFNLKDESFVSQSDASRLTKVIYHSLREIIGSQVRKNQMAGQSLI